MRMKTLSTPFPAEASVNAPCCPHSQPTRGMTGHTGQEPFPKEEKFVYFYNHHELIGFPEIATMYSYPALCRASWCFIHLLDSFNSALQGRHQGRHLTDKKRESQTLAPKVHHKWQRPDSPETRSARHQISSSLYYFQEKPR